MSTTAFLQRYDTFPDKIKEELSIIADFLLFSYGKENNNLVIPSTHRLTDTEFSNIIENSAMCADEGKILSTEQAKNIAKTWRKK